MSGTGIFPRVGSQVFLVFLPVSSRVQMAKLAGGNVGIDLMSLSMSSELKL